MNLETPIIDTSQAALFGYLDGLQVRVKAGSDVFSGPELAQAYEVAYRAGLAMRGKHWKKP